MFLFLFTTRFDNVNVCFPMPIKLFERERERETKRETDGEKERDGEIERDRWRESESVVKADLCVFRSEVGTLRVDPDYWAREILFSPTLFQDHRERGPCPPDRDVCLHCVTIHSSI